jgi:5-(carboxyamino)imidazole ribonucleotide synthase
MQNTIRPGGTIGILGSGPMAHLLALAARNLGYYVRLLDAPRDPEAASRLARECDVVTVASEDVPRDVLDAAAHHAPLRPGVIQIAIAQERRAEREWLEKAGLTVAPWRSADTREQLVSAVAELGVSIIKPRLRKRADLRPLLVAGPREAAAAWIAMRGMPTVVEALVPIDSELSVLVARAIDGTVETFPPALSVREYGELVWSVLPGPIAPQLAKKAQDLATYVARKLDVQGLLAVEMFVLTDGRLVVNELVPAPHPAFLTTESACVTGQLEQLVRAITGLPLAATTVVQPSAAVPIRRAASGSRAQARVERALEVAGTRAVLYAPPDTLPEGAAIGHLYAVGNTPGDAIARASLARRRLTRSKARPGVSRRRSRAEQRS